MISNDAYRLIAEDVTRAAKASARKWSGVIDPEDMEQEMWLRIAESTDYSEKLAEMDDAARTSVLNKMGSQIASGYRNDYEKFSGNYIYSTDEVRELLESGALGNLNGGELTIAVDHDESVDNQEVAQRVVSRKETVTERIDLELGLKALAKRNSSYYAAIVNMHIYGIRPVDDTARRTLNRAIDALTEEMNWSFKRRFDEYEGPGKRVVR